MKKILILNIALLAFSLSGCSAFVSENYFSMSDLEIDICENDCLSQEDFDNVILLGKEQRESYDVYFHEDDQYEEFDLIFGEVLSRSLLNRADIMNTNLPIPFYYSYNQFNEGVNRMSMLIDVCAEQDPCEDIPYLTGGEYTLNEFTYGYEAQSGYYKMIIDKNQDKFRVESFKYVIKENETDYELYLYQPLKGDFEYTSMKDGIYRAYFYSSTANSYAYSYMNTKTKELIYYSFGESSTSIFYFNTKEELSYNFDSPTGRFKVASYEDLEFITSLSKEEAGFKVEMNFHFISDWDTFLCQTNESECKLYQGSQLVFRDYNIVINSTSFYNSVIGTKTLSANEFEAYEFPNSLEENHSLSKIKRELQEFIDLENVNEILPFTNEEFLDAIADLVAYLETN